jgi:cytochrome P450 / NADPH-cytochrome P450 reductase
VTTEIKSTLTMKPDNFTIKVRRRPGRTINYGPHGQMAPSSSPPAATAHANGNDSKPQADPPKTKPLAIFFGGNTGTCKAFAEDIQTSIMSLGFTVPGGIKNLDEAVENLPTDRPVLIITSSYEGLPPDNAKNFVAWLEARATSPTSENLLAGVTYSVFGAGNKDWAATFHRIPKLVNEHMAKLGAKQIYPAAFVDVSEDIVGPFEDWKAGLFPELEKLTGATVHGKGAELKVEISQPAAPKKLAGEEVSEGLVLANRQIVPKGVGPKKMHMEILLPGGEYCRSGKSPPRSPKC